MITEPEIVHTTACPAAVIHLTIPRAEVRNVMGPSLREVKEAVAAQGIGCAEPWYTRHLRMDPGIFDFEIGVPVTRPVSPVGRVRAGQLPAATVARAVYHGDYEGLAGAWAELDAWIAAGGYTPAAGLWERYLAGPESGADPAAWRTELNWPVSRQPSA